MGESVLRVSPASRLIITLFEVRTSPLEVPRLIMTELNPSLPEVGPTMEVAGSAGSGLELAVATDALWSNSE
jgi:hypothetical protein